MVDGQTDGVCSSLPLRLLAVRSVLLSIRSLTPTLRGASSPLLLICPRFNLAYLGDRKTQNKEFNMNGNDAADNGIDAVGGTLTTELTTVD
jgi:hypothetical protein